MATNRPVWVVVTAAGSGSRLGHSVPKALVEVGGTPALTRVLITLSQIDEIEGVVVTYPSEHAEAFEASVPARLPFKLHMISGGPSRQASVFRGLQVVSEQASDALVLIHDAARCLAPASAFERVIGHLRDGAVAITTALPVADTIKLVSGEQDLALVVETPTRHLLRAVQTPQGFDLGRLIDAHRQLQQISEDETIAAPDDAAIMEALEYPVRVCQGDEMSFKITTAKDLALANLLAQPVKTQRGPFEGRN